MSAKVLIAGAGIAGIEAALALRDLAGDRVEIAVRDPRREFSFRPFAIGEPYGGARVFRYDLRRLVERCGASFRTDGIVSVDPERQVAVTRDGDELHYEHLIVAGGVRMIVAIPGAAPFWGDADEGQVGNVIADLRAGALRHLIFTMPAGPSWVLPLYELALLGATELSKAGVVGARLTVVTPEDAPLALYGRRAGMQVRRLLEERGIEVVAGSRPVAFNRGRLRTAPGEEIEADAVISLPRLEGRQISGIPHDPDGFVGIDEHGGVIGLEHVFAAGDVTAFPVKQGGIATQQADVVAEAIASSAGAEVEPQPFGPVLRGVPGPARDGKVIGRYLTSFLDLLAEGDDPTRTVRSSSPA